MAKNNRSFPQNRKKANLNAIIVLTETESRLQRRSPGYPPPWIPGVQGNSEVDYQFGDEAVG